MSMQPFNKQEIKTVTQDEWAKLKENDEESKFANLSDQLFDPKPVIKLFDSWGPSTWLISQCDDAGMACGLCDLGQGFPELGSVYLPSIVEALGMRLEKDLYWEADKTLLEYSKIARKNQRIVS